MWTGINARRLTQKDIAHFREDNFRITATTATEFGASYYDNNLVPGKILDSEMPSRAVITLQTLLPDRGAEFASAIQSAYFRQGKDLNDTDTYREICRGFGVNTTLFLETFHLPYLFELTKEAFRTAEIYAKAYPSFWLESKKSFYLVKQGYAPFVELVERIENILSTKRG
jgi:putative protein-disulfide isomerase